MSALLTLTGVALIALSATCIYQVPNPPEVLPPIPAIMYGLASLSTGFVGAALIIVAFSRGSS